MDSQGKLIWRRCSKYARCIWKENLEFREVLDEVRLLPLKLVVGEASWEIAKIEEDAGEHGDEGGILKGTR